MITSKEWSCAARSLWIHNYDILFLFLCLSHDSNDSPRSAWRWRRIIIIIGFDGHIENLCEMDKSFWLTYWRLMFSKYSMNRFQLFYRRLMTYEDRTNHENHIYGIFDGGVLFFVCRRWKVITRFFEVNENATSTVTILSGWAIERCLKYTVMQWHTRFADE